MRYLKITLSGAVLFLVYLWITVMLNSCNGNSKVPVNSGDEIELLEEEMTSGDYDDEFEGDDETFGAKPGNENNDSDFTSTLEEDDDYTAGDYTSGSSNTPEKRFPSADSKPSTSTKTTSNSKSQGNTTLNPRTKKSTSNSTPRSTASAGGTSGEYMVIAGSYLLEENANKMIKKLQGLGYSNAEIVHFDQSQYHSICAGKYDSSSSASKTAGSLKGNGIDSYVHRKQW